MGTLLSERLQTALDELEERTGEKHTRNWLAGQVGISRTAIYKWFDGRTLGLEGENLMKASRALGVNADWLATGRGPMRGHSSPSQLPDELEEFIQEHLLPVWKSRSITKESLRLLGDFVSSLAGSSPKNMSGTADQDKEILDTGSRLLERMQGKDSEPNQDKPSKNDLN